MLRRFFGPSLGIFQWANLPKILPEISTPYTLRPPTSYAYGCNPIVASCIEYRRVTRILLNGVGGPELKAKICLRLTDGGLGRHFCK